MLSRAAATGLSMRMVKTVLIIMVVGALGGFLYGFDIGVISGALVFMKSDLSISAEGASLVIAAVLGGGSLATLFAGPFADRFGRRFSINVATVVFIIGVIILVPAPNFATVMVGRVVQGIGVGIFIIVIPLYLAETVPSRWRGRGVLSFHLCLTFGILMGYVVNYAFESTGSWRFMFAVALIPSVLLLIGSLSMLPRSPRWLCVKGHMDEACNVLSRVQGNVDVDQTLKEIKAAIAEENTRSGGVWDLMLRGGYRKAFLIALAIGILNQLTGINVLLQLNATILGASGLHTAIFDSIGVGLANFIVTIIGMALVDIVGRRPLLIFGAAGVTVALAFIGVMHALALPASFVGYATLVGLMAFTVFFAIGPGAVALLTISEILPLAIRAKGMGIALFANSLTSAGLAAVFMGMVAAIGYGSVFLLLAFFTLLYVLLAIFALPEAKGRSLEEIEKGFLIGHMVVSDSARDAC